MNKELIAPSRHVITRHHTSPPTTLPNNTTHTKPIMNIVTKCLDYIAFAAFLALFTLASVGLSSFLVHLVFKFF